MQQNFGGSSSASHVPAGVWGGVRFAWDPLVAGQGGSCSRGSRDASTKVLLEVVPLGGHAAAPSLAASPGRREKDAEAPAWWVMVSFPVPKPEDGSSGTCGPPRLAPA